MYLRFIKKPYMVIARYYSIFLLLYFFKGKISFVLQKAPSKELDLLKKETQKLILNKKDPGGTSRFKYTIKFTGGKKALFLFFLYKIQSRFTHCTWLPCVLSARQARTFLALYRFKEPFTTFVKKLYHLSCKLSTVCISMIIPVRLRTGHVT